MDSIPERPLEPHDPTSRLDPPDPTEADRECAREELALLRLNVGLYDHIGETDGRDVVSDALGDLDNSQLAAIAMHVRQIAESDPDASEAVRFRLAQLVYDAVMRYAESLPADEAVERHAEYIRDMRLTATMLRRRETDEA